MIDFEIAITNATRIVSQVLIFLNVISIENHGPLIN